MRRPAMRTAMQPLSRFVYIFKNKVSKKKLSRFFYFVRYTLLFTTKAWATETTHANTIKLAIIIIFYTFLFLLMLSLIKIFSSRFTTNTLWSAFASEVLCFFMFFMSKSPRGGTCSVCVYFVKSTLLFTTTASTTAAQQIAKIKPKIIIILILSFVILNLFTSLGMRKAQIHISVNLRTLFGTNPAELAPAFLRGRFPAARSS